MENNILALGDLTVFVAVVEQGGVLKAARRLHRVPSNVSTRIQQLEAQVGETLFFRHKRRMSLTPKGEVLLEYARRLLELADETHAAVTNPEPRGRLRIGSLESTTASRLPKILAAYHRAYPDVAVEMITGTNDALVAALNDRRIEGAFVAEVPADANVQHLKLFEERLMLITARDHAKVRSPRDIEGDSIIAFPVGCAYRRKLQGWLGQHALVPVRTLELSSYHAIVACVGSGAGVALMPESVLDAMPNAVVARHPIPQAFSKVTTPFIWRSDTRSRPLEALQDLLRDRTAKR